MAGPQSRSGVSAAPWRGRRRHFDADGPAVGPVTEFVPHHLAHAASAYYPSGFDAAAILVIDGIGEADCSMLGRGDGLGILYTRNVSPTHPHSLGFLWEQLNIYLGFSPYDASKVMGLAAYGDPEVFREQFASIVAVSEDSYSIDLEAIDFKSIEMQRLQARLGPMRDMDEENPASSQACCSCLAGGNGCRGHRSRPTSRTQRRGAAPVPLRRRGPQLRHELADQPDDRLFGNLHSLSSA